MQLRVDFVTRICYPVGMAEAMTGLFQKRGWWYYWPPTPKGEVRKKAMALRTKDYAAAVQAAVKIRDAEELVWVAKRGTLNQVLPIYYREKRADAKSTRRIREAVLGAFSEILGNPKVDRLSSEMISDWREHLLTKGGTLEGRKSGRQIEAEVPVVAGKKKGKKILVDEYLPCSLATVRGYMIVVKAFLNWAREHGYLRADPMQPYRKQTIVNVTRVQEFRTRDDRDLLFAHAGESRDYVELVLLMGFYHGLRDGEMLAMTLAWIWIAPDWSQGKISVQDTDIIYTDGTKGVWQPKGRRRREIPMHSKLLAYFKDHGISAPFVLAPEKDRWPAESKQSKRFDVKNSLRNLAKRAEVAKLNFHIMRHSFATHLAELGVPIVKIAALLGDRVSVTEANYIGFVPSKENLVERL